jgi:hypothetical protein
MAPAKTGKDKTSKKVVIPTLQINNDNRSIVIPLERIFKMVLIKLIEPIIEEAPAKCKLKIAKSTDLPLCPIFLDKGG